MKRAVVTRSQILAYRLRANHLDRRVPRASLDRAAFAGLQDSVPRSALLSLHARVEAVDFTAWEDPGFVQVWGPRGAVYVIVAEDLAVFTLGRLPRDSDRRKTIEEDARNIRDLLGGSDRLPLETVTEGSVRRVREAAAAGTIRIRWDGSSSEIWASDPPSVEPESCRLELARRYLQALGPSRQTDFASWAGISRQDANHTWEGLRSELAEVHVGRSTGWLLLEHQDLLTESSEIPNVIRLLPPGDAYLLARDRGLVVPHREHQSQLWAQGNVPPGGLMVNGEVAGTWRRQGHSFTINSWKSLDSKARDVVEAEIAAMPPLDDAQPNVRWGLT